MGKAVPPPQAGFCLISTEAQRSELGDGGGRFPSGSVQLWLTSGGVVGAGVNQAQPSPAVVYCPLFQGWEAARAISKYTSPTPHTGKGTKSSFLSPRWCCQGRAGQRQAGDLMMGTHFPAAHPAGRVPAGSTVYTCMLNRQGGVESDLTVSRISPGAPGSPLAPAFEGKTLSPGMLEGGALAVFTFLQLIISELSFIFI